MLKQFKIVCLPGLVFVQEYNSNCKLVNNVM